MKINHIILAIVLSLIFSSFMNPRENSSSNTIFDFNASADLSSWSILNDGVMGGVSTSTFSINADGHGLFEGNVSTLNNGGFASVRHRPDPMDISKKSKVSIRLKGDGKSYQFRLKKNISDFESFITTFETSGSWETINIELSELYPSFRGRKLNQPNYDSSQLAELCFLIANKKNESFKLLIDTITIT